MEAELAAGEEYWALEASGIVCTRAAPCMLRFGK